MQADFFRDWNLEQDEMVWLIVKGLRKSPYQIVSDVNAMTVNHVSMRV